jgi:vacuolar-type H+-ATPase subunit E/Vma4
VLEEERHRLEAESVRALSRARLARDHAILGEMRRQMAEVRRKAEARLPAMDDAEVLARLVDEVAAELGDGPLEFQVRDGHEEHLRVHLGLQHPHLLPRATIHGSPDDRGGVLVALGGRQILDNTLPSRLQNAWQALEPEIAALLLGEGHGGP